MIYDNDSMLKIAEDSFKRGFAAGRIGAYAKGFEDQALSEHLRLTREKLGIKGDLQDGRREDKSINSGV